MGKVGAQYRRIIIEGPLLYEKAASGGQERGLNISLAMENYDSEHFPFFKVRTIKSAMFVQVDFEFCLNEFE